MNVSDKEQQLHRAWVRQLYEEHRTICWQYRISLPRPIIELSQAKGRWGSWDPHQRTIRLAARLVREHSWDVVIGVLKHEMAHQVVSDIFGREDGHGEWYHRAADLIGVPAEFRSADGEVPKVPEHPHPASSREHQMLDKVKKLLALARSANEHEACLAMEKANALIEKYNLERIEKNADAKYTYRIINHRKKRIENYQRMICSILTDHFFVEIVYSYLYDPQQDETHRTIELLGTAENVEIAEYVYAFLGNQLEVLWRQYQTMTRAAERSKRSYWLGVLRGFAKKLASAQKKPEAHQNQASRALQCLGDPRLEQFKAARFPRLVTRSHQGASFDPLVFHAGIAEGTKLNIYNGVTSQDGNRGRLLE